VIFSALLVADFQIGYFLLADFFDQQGQQWLSIRADARAE
jgi:hypothetical protein